jgi:hypothetical protein
MKTHLISSPAYRANGHHGVYLSIAICQDNGEFVKVIGDHTRGWIGTGYFTESYTNINEIVGLPFSDADRFIQTREIKLDENILSEWEKAYTQSELEQQQWDKNRLEFMNGDSYSFLYEKKGKPIAENHAKYNQWAKENPCPVSVDGYDFLKAIIHEN